MRRFVLTWACGGTRGTKKRSTRTAGCCTDEVASLLSPTRISASSCAKTGTEAGRGATRGRGGGAGKGYDGDGC
eukprot:500207-Rhodomonas_salina.3